MSDYSEKPKTKQTIPTWFTYVTFGITIMMITTFIVFGLRNNHWDIAHSNTFAQLNNSLIRIDTQTSRYIIRSTVPILERNAGEEDPFTLIHLNWSEIYWQIAANVRNTSPQEILKTQFSLLAFMKPRTLPIQLPPQQIITPELSPPIEIPAETPTPILASQPEVLIYHTHTSESYIPVNGKDHELNQQGDIVKVGEHLQQVLEEKYNIRCIHAEDIHDQYPFRDSYKRSQLTILKYLNEYPSIHVVLDVHRDATPGFRTTCEINGEKTATLFLVVGSDKMGLPHPNWKKNLDFATKLTENLNLYYPGLSNGIIISEARYNQHLHDHALIIEIGNFKDSTLEYVYRATERFAEILALTLNKEKQ